MSSIYSALQFPTVLLSLKLLCEWVNMRLKSIFYWSMMCSSFRKWNCKINFSTKLSENTRQSKCIYIYACLHHSYSLVVCPIIYSTNIAYERWLCDDTLSWIGIINGYSLCIKCNHFIRCKTVPSKFEYLPWI